MREVFVAIVASGFLVSSPLAFSDASSSVQREELSDCQMAYYLLMQKEVEANRRDKAQKFFAPLSLFRKAFVKKSQEQFGEGASTDPMDTAFSQNLPAYFKGYDWMQNSVFVKKLGECEVLFSSLKVSGNE